MTASAKSPVRQVDGAELQRLVADEDALVIEVLPEHEFREFHIAGAVNIPLKKLGPEAVERIDRSRPLIVYCWDHL